MNTHTSSKKSFPWLAVLPLFIFLGLAILFYSLLTTEDRDTTALPSALLNQPAPNLIVPELRGLQTGGTQVPGMSGDTFKGKVSVVNVFASWCIPCRQEHPQIVALGDMENIQVIGINHRDQRQNALAFLEELGNPYDVVGVDRQGRASIEWGVYGVPETFLVDGSGTIFYKHVGPISEKQLKQVFVPLLEQKLSDTN